MSSLLLFLFSSLPFGSMFCSRCSCMIVFLLFIVVLFFSFSLYSLVFLLFFLYSFVPYVHGLAFHCARLLCVVVGPKDEYQTAYCHHARWAGTCEATNLLTQANKQTHANTRI